MTTILADAPIHQTALLRARVNRLEAELALERRRRATTQNALVVVRALLREAADELDRHRHVGDCDDLVARLREVGR